MAKKGEIRDGVRGAWVEFGTFTLDPASINDNAQGAEAVAISGAKAGDLVFVSPEAFDTGLIPAGAKVTNTDEVTVYINNESGGAVNGASKTWNYILVHLS
jgi:hypothetical protein